MKKNIKKLFLVFFLIFVFFYFSSSFIEAAYTGLVPCGCVAWDKQGRCCAQSARDEHGEITCIEQGVPCQFCHFFVFFKKIIDFVLVDIVPVLAILILAIGGFMYIFAYLFPEGALGGESGPGLVSRANKLFISVGIGLIIIFSAWLIVNTFFMVIGVAEWTGLKEEWWKIDCPIK